MATKTKKIATRMTLLRRAIIISCVSIAALSFRSAAAQTPTPITSCGNVSGAVLLMNNLSTGNAACLIVTASNTTIDGNGKSITALNDAIAIASKSTVTIKNIVTSSGVSISGTSSFVTLQDSTVGFIGNYSADDTTINRVTMTGIAVQGSETDPALRTRFTNNTVSGNGNTLADFMGSLVGPCPRTDFVVTNNAFTSSYRCPGTCDEPKTLFMRCGTHNTVTGNTIRSTGDAMGVRFRDEFDNSLVENNTFRVDTAEGAFAAFNITAGNADKHHPRNNTFTKNTIRGEHDAAMYLQSSGNNNTFSYNTIWSNDNYSGNTINNAPGTNTFDHNTFVNAGTGRIAYLTYQLNATDTWTNNIFSYEGRETFWYDGWNFSRYSGNNNLFHSRTGSASFSPYASSLTAWKSAATPDDAGSIEGDPLFVNAASGNFSLLSNSPVVARSIGATQTTQSCTENWSCSNWSACANASQTRTCTDGNACGTTSSRPPLTQSCDSVPPTISITSPAHTSTVSGLVTLQVTAADNIAVAGVQFTLDGASLGTEDTTAPYSYDWDTSTTTPATHMLVAIARDSSGNTTSAIPISVTVTSPTPAAPTTPSPASTPGGTTAAPLSDSPA
jgi:hypothetical protein